MSTSDNLPARDLVEHLQEVERRLADLERSAGLESASIGAGGLRVRDGGKIEILNDEGDVVMSLSAGRLDLSGRLEVVGRLNFPVDHPDADEEFALPPHMDSGWGRDTTMPGDPEYPFLWIVVPDFDSFAGPQISLYGRDINDARRRYIAIETEDLSFFGQTRKAGKQSVTGSRGGNAALADLLQALHNLNLIDDDTTA